MLQRGAAGRGTARGVAATTHAARPYVPRWSRAAAARVVRAAAPSPPPAQDTARGTEAAGEAVFQSSSKKKRRNAVKPPLSSSEGEDPGVVGRPAGGNSHVPAERNSWNHESSRRDAVTAPAQALAPRQARLAVAAAAALGARCCRCPHCLAVAVASSSRAPRPR